MGVEEDQGACGGSPGGAGREEGRQRLQREGAGQCREGQGLEDGEEENIPKVYQSEELGCQSFEPSPQKATSKNREAEQVQSLQP